MPGLEELEWGRALCARGAWLDAHGLLSRADQSAPLGAENLELLATSAYMLGRDEEYVGDLERAHQLYLDAGETLRAARTAFWVGMQLMLAGETSRGTGWLGRARRLVEREAEECVEQGYLLLPLAFQREAMGELAAAAATAGDAAAIAERFGDRDLFALAVHMQGHLLVRGGHVGDGLGLLDEAMVAVTTGELSPIVSGIVYCGVIMGCQAAYEPRRAQEWTAALTRWCERQPDMVAFSGRCHVHRAEIMQLKGAWSDALEEARCAASRAAQGNHRSALAEAAYVQGEVHRLRGAFGAAEEAYRESSRYGRDPHPGQALLRLAQGNADAAVASIRRVLGETTVAADRVRLLPACAEIMLAAGDVESARRASDELAEIARDHEAGVLCAIVSQTRGAVDLAAGDPGTALLALRPAWRVWEEIEAPYEAARVRALIGAACRALEDDDAAALELGAARRAFVELGAAVDIARLDLLARGVDAAESEGLTARELQVLRLVAAGRTNKAIAAELVLSERTVDRHVSNIFTKLRVSSRAAATAHAYEHQLV
jgi:DNA-binding CsgD family transcriptional regulator/TPR repeat protein